MKRFRSYFLLFLLAILFLEVWIGFPIAIEVSPPNRRELVEDGSEPLTHQKATGVHLVETREGQRDWELNASRASSDRGDGSWDLEEVRVRFYNQRNVEFTVTGARGFFDGKTRDIRIEGRVKTTTANGYAVDTDSILYSAGDRTLESPGLVNIVGAPKFGGRSIRLKGHGLISWVDRRELAIEHRVEASYPLRDRGDVHLNADRVLLKTIDSSAQFDGNVAVKLGEKEIRSPQALFLYGEETDLLQAIQMKGGVKMTDGPRLAESDSVRFDPEANSYILSGGVPRVVQGEDEIKGAEITLLDGGRKIKVKDMKAKVEQNK